MSVFSQSFIWSNLVFLGSFAREFYPWTATATALTSALAASYGGAVFDILLRRGWHRHPPEWLSLRLCRAASVLCLIVIPISLFGVAAAPTLARSVVVRTVLESRHGSGPELAFRLAWKNVVREQGARLPEDWPASALPRVDSTTDRIISSAYVSTLLGQARRERPWAMLLCGVEDGQVALALEQFLSNHFQIVRVPAASAAPLTLEAVRLTARALDATLRDLEGSCRPARLVGLALMASCLLMATLFLVAAGAISRRDIPLPRT